MTTTTSNATRTVTGAAGATGASPSTSGRLAPAHRATSDAVLLTRRGAVSIGRARPQDLRRAVVTEWIKTRSLRGTWIGMGSVVAMLVGFGALAAAMSTGTVASPDGDGPPGGGDPLSTVLTGATFAVLVVGVLGSLAGAREYSSRMIAATVAAVPRRWQVVVSKSVVFAGVTLATALIGVLGAFFLGMAILSGDGAATVALGDDGVLRQVLGMAAYVAAIGLIGLGLGIILRSVAGSIGAVVAGVLILPTIAGALLPDSWDAVLQYLPSSAAAAFTSVQGAGAETLSAGAGALVLLAWVLAALGGAAVSISRRDV